MIWVKGRVVADDELTISVLDRTFEHGLGLFETMRTWNGRAALLDRHLGRLIASAAELKIPIDPEALPDHRAVATLLAANRSAIRGEALIRLTLSGGTSEIGGSTLWLRARPLPEPTWKGSAKVGILPFGPFPSSSAFARFKSLNYLDRARLYEQGRSLGFDEVLVRDGSLPIEGSRTNLFAVAGQRLKTPSDSAAIVPGIMRGVVLEAAGGLGMIVVEETWPGNVMIDAEEVFLTNAVRGIIPVGALDSKDHAAPGMQSRTWDAPGPWTRRLIAAVEARLSSGEEFS